MDWWVQIIGAKAYRIHITQGMVAYGLILIHPLMESLIVYKITGSVMKSIFVFVPKLETQREIYLTLGRTALLLMTISVIAAFFRTNPVLRRNWRKLHVLNYLTFYIVYYHMRVGSDITTAPFVWVSWVALASISLSFIYRFIYPQISKFRQLKLNEIKDQKA